MVRTTRSGGLPGNAPEDSVLAIPRSWRAPEEVARRMIADAVAEAATHTSDASLLMHWRVERALAPKIAAALADLSGELEQARGYLIRNVLQPLHPDIEPLPNLIGVCTQVDSVTAGLRGERAKGEFEMSTDTLRTEPGAMHWHRHLHRYLPVDPGQRAGGLREVLNIMQRYIDDGLTSRAERRLLEEIRNTIRAYANEIGERIES